MPDTDERINAFPPVTKAEWLAKVEADLKGASPDRLRSTGPGGLVVEPLYTREDPAGASPAGFPGVPPYIRGSAPAGAWIIRQEYDDPRPAVCKQQIEQDLAHGVEGIWVRLGPRSGCRIFTMSELEELFSSVDLQSTSVWVDGGADGLATAAGLLAIATRKGVAHDVLRGGFGLDPVGLLARDGRIQGGLNARLAGLRDLGFWCAEHASGMRAVSVSGDPYDGGGASTAQELAYTVATGLEYLRQLTDAGLSVDQAAKQIGFSYAISGDFFTQIAKLRAARWVWAKVVTAAGGQADAAAMAIHCRTSRFTKTERDPWVNMLRVTAECTAAVLGGAQSVATLPFDCVIGPPDALSQRVARNTQVVLREESHLDAVADPAGGSWFVENLTNDLARAAWSELQRVEASGGIVAALGSGYVVTAVSEVAAGRRKSLARRKTPIVGVSEYPNLSEASVEREPVSAEQVRDLVKGSLDRLDLGAHRDALLALSKTVADPGRKLGALVEAAMAATTSGTDMYGVAAVLQHGQPSFHVEPIPQWRAAEAWEQLRRRSDACEVRPTAFLANLGSIPSHKARSTWVQNLLAGAGIGAVPNDGFHDAAGLARAFEESRAPLAVVCGSDADYESMLEPAVAALKRAGCSRLLVAGRPKVDEAVLRDSGVSDFVFVGADVLGVMSDVLDSIGVPR